MHRQQFYDVPEGNIVVYDEFLDTGYRVYPNLFCKPEERLEHFDRVKNMDIRDDDIILASYPKVGANWLWEMMTMLLHRHSDITSGSKISGMLESTPVNVIDSMPSPRILSAHIKVNILPKQVAQKKTKCVLLCRNPKDVAVSFYNHTVGLAPYQYSGKFENFLAMFMRGDVDFGSYPEYLVEWQRLLNDNPDWEVHVMKYEDLKLDCFHELKKLCHYLNHVVDDELIQNTVNKCHFRNMKAEKPDKFHPKFKGMLKKMAKNGFSLFRKGQIGDWKNWFTDSQRDAFDKWWRDETSELEMIKFE